MAAGRSARSACGRAGRRASWVALSLCRSRLLAASVMNEQPPAVPARGQVVGVSVGVGGAKGIRTPDLLNAIQTLSQLSYSPTPDREYSVRNRARRTTARARVRAPRGAARRGARTHLPVRPRRAPAAPGPPVSDRTSGAPAHPPCGTLVLCSGAAGVRIRRRPHGGPARGTRGSGEVQACRSRSGQSGPNRPSRASRRRRAPWFPCPAADADARRRPRTRARGAPARPPGRDARRDRPRVRRASSMRRPTRSAPGRGARRPGHRQQGAAVTRDERMLLVQQLLDEVTGLRPDRAVPQRRDR